MQDHAGPWLRSSESSGSLIQSPSPFTPPTTHLQRPYALDASPRCFFRCPSNGEWPAAACAGATRLTRRTRFVAMLSESESCEHNFNTIATTRLPTPPPLNNDTKLTARVLAVDEGRHPYCQTQNRAACLSRMSLEVSLSEEEGVLVLPRVSVECHEEVICVPTKKCLTVATRILWRRQLCPWRYRVEASGLQSSMHRRLDMRAPTPAQLPACPKSQALAATRWRAARGLEAAAPGRSAHEPRL